MIAQIIPYFGKLPEWIDLYFYSCSRNPMVDFIFYTDCDCYPPQGCNNLIIRRLSYDEYKELVSKRLGIEFNPQNAYKLTDLKPFLGLVHKEELSGYDWWGFGDIDLVYGDMSLLLNKENLSKYNLLTTHNYHIAGHCTFMRNNDYYRNLCLKIKDWETRLPASKHYGFDEGEWSRLLYPMIKWPLTIYDKILKRIYPKCFNLFMDHANSVINRSELFKEYETSLAPKAGEVWRYDVNEGRVYSPTGKQLPYLHFLFFKKTQYLETENYWRPGYYKLNKNIADYRRILIDYSTIKGEL